MGTWYPPDEMNEQWKEWKEFASQHWGLGEPVSADKYTRVRSAWDNGFFYGHEEIKNE